MERVILHSDMNNYYASVECMLNPSLKNEYIAVCGNKEDRHGIVLAKNQSAKLMGVITGEPIWKAMQKCPKLKVVPPHYDEYIKYSKLAREIYYSYTDLIEPFGLDECWLDVTGSISLFGNGEAIAEIIRERIKKELGLTVSIGVSFNKIFAKLGSDMKKPDAVTSIKKSDFKNTVWPLPVSELLYIGPATTKKLNRLNIRTIGELANTPLELIQKWLGKNGIMLYNFANGFDTSRVSPYGYKAPIKSISHGITCTSDLTTPEEVWKIIFYLSQDVSHRLRAEGLTARGVSITIRDSFLNTKEFQTKFLQSTRSHAVIAREAFKMYQSQYDNAALVRSISVRALYLSSSQIPIQTTLFSDAEKDIKQDKIETAIEGLRERFGKESVTYASLMGKLKLPNSSLHVMPDRMYM